MSDPILAALDPISLEFVYAACATCNRAIGEWRLIPALESVVVTVAVEREIERRKFTSTRTMSDASWRRRVCDDWGVSYDAYRKRRREWSTKANATV
jgi:hypothetical protein